MCSTNVELEIKEIKKWEKRRRNEMNTTELKIKCISFVKFLLIAVRRFVQVGQADIQPTNHSLIHSLIHPSIHSSIHPSIHPLSEEKVHKFVAKKKKKLSL